MHAVRPSRGQTLILFALSLLLLTLMVSLTLSMGMKVRERTELQTVADAAAFSNAVATARAFNNIAVLNRAQIAFAVSQAGAQSLISWSTAYMAYVEGTYNNVSDIQIIYDIFAALCICAPFNGFCAKACKCGIKGIKDTNKINKRVNTERKRLKAAYQALDDAAATEVYRMQYTQLALYADQQYAFQTLRSDLGGEEYAKKIRSKAAPSAPPGEWTIASAAGDLSKDEVSGGAACTSGGAACDLPLTVAHAVSAAMGSRGFPFVSGRALPIFSAPFDLQLLRVMPPPDSSFVVGHSGSGWFTGPHSAIQSLPPYALAAGADDHGVLITLYEHQIHGGGLPCPPIMGWVTDVDVDLRATGTVPVHKWSPGGKDKSPFVHWLIPCKALPSSCPGIWPPFVDYNILQVNREANNYGQPKNFALVQRNPAARPMPDPFNLAFNFTFSPSTGGSRFDNRTPATATQSALSTGIAYYHRGALILQHWNEPPNLLNPYWRATLVAADTDATGLDDAATVLGKAGDVEGSQAVRALVSQGYKGIQ